LFLLLRNSAEELRNSLLHCRAPSVLVRCAVLYLTAHGGTELGLQARLSLY
jgi:hypothetical protein